MFQVNFVIEALQLSEYLGAGLPLSPLHKQTTNNVLVIHSDGSYFTVYDETLKIGESVTMSYDVGVGHIPKDTPRFRFRKHIFLHL